MRRFDSCRGHHNSNCIADEMPAALTNSLEKPELLAPAGNYEKLEIAIHYGADAVYLAGKDFSLRNFSDNFSEEELFKAVDLAHRHAVKVYLACNIFSRNHENRKLRTFLKRVGEISPDAVIISDPGIILLAREIIPEISIHLSTQANTTNLNSVRFWHKQGVKRVNLARELSLSEIREISENAPIETETFIHGAMCISYSGRCLLSSFLSGRDSNRGLCSHPCRWKYAVMEELRPNEYFPAMEDQRGTYLFNSKDLCMIGHIPELIRAGISSFKIEGRMKGIHYLASVVKTYRNAIDSYFRLPATYRTDPEWIKELERVFHRNYCTGFYFDSPDETLQNYNNDHKGEIHGFIGKIIGTSAHDHEYIVAVRNKLHREDLIEILSPEFPPFPIPIQALTDMDGHPIPCAQPNTLVLLTIETTCRPNDIVRKG